MIEKYIEVRKNIIRSKKTRGTYKKHLILKIVSDSC